MARDKQWRRQPELADLSCDPLGEERREREINLPPAPFASGDHAGWHLATPLPLLLQQGGESNPDMGRSILARQTWLGSTPVGHRRVG